MLKIKKVEQLITWQSSLNDNLILLYSNLGLPLHCYHCLTLFGMQAHFFKNRFHIFNSCRIEHNWIEHNTSLTAQLIILPAHVLSILRTKRTRAQTEKTRRKLTKRKNRKKKKGDHYKETINRNNENRNNKNKTNVYVLGDSIIKKLNGYLLTRKIKHKHLVKVRSFSVAKISCMTDLVKPPLQDINPDHIILHAGTNDLKT